LFPRAGARHRASRATIANDQSSRSHAIFTLLVTHKAARGPRGEATKTSKFHFVDLAGSERLQLGGADDTHRMKETQYINKGLLALGNLVRVRPGSFRV
jgi:hypothetical protein